MSAKSVAAKIGRVLLYLLLIGGLLPAGRRIYEKISSVRQNERYVQEMVSANSPKLPRMMQNGRVRWDSIQGSNNVVTYTYTFVHSRKAELDTVEMARSSESETLKKMSDDQRTADMIFRGIDVRLLYRDMDALWCYSVDITKDTLLQYRREQLQQAAP